MSESLPLKVKYSTPLWRARIKRRKTVIVFASSIACSLFVSVILLHIFLNSMLLKQIIGEEIKKRIPEGYSSSFTVDEVSIFGSFRMNRFELSHRDILIGYAEKCSVSGLYSIAFGAPAVGFECGHGYFFSDTVLADLKGMDLGSSGPNHTPGKIPISIHVSVKTATFVYRDFHETFSLDLVWSGKEKKVSLLSGKSGVDIRDFDPGKKSARVILRNIKPEKYLAFLPKLDGRLSGTLDADVHVTLVKGPGLLLNVKHSLLSDIVVYHSFLYDKPFSLASYGFSGNIFLSNDILSVEGKHVFPGFEISTKIYKWNNLVMGDLSARHVSFNGLAKIIKPNSGTLFNNFNMAGDVSVACSFSARMRKKISLERFRLLVDVSETRQLSKRMDFLKGDFFCYVYDDKGAIHRLLVGGKNPFFTAFGKLPKYVPGAVISCEDKGFYRHRAIDPWGIQRAMRANFSIKNEYLQGGSTLTQQIVKNLFLTMKKNLVRKLEEIILSFEIEATIPKERILEIYLNVVEMGPNMHGIGEASRTFFGKSAYDISPLESAYLASTLIKPKFFYSIFYARNWISDFWQKRLRSLLNAMVCLDYITEEECSQNDPAGFQFYKRGG
jgi:hypothetical protein